MKQKRGTTDISFKTVPMVELREGLQEKGSYVQNLSENPMKIVLLFSWPKYRTSDALSLGLPCFLFFLNILTSFFLKKPAKWGFLSSQ